MKKILSLFLALVSLTPTTGFAATAATNADAELYERAVSYLEEHEFIPTGSWDANPDAGLTKIEFLSLVVEHLYPADLVDHCFSEITSPPDFRYTLLFKDVGRASRDANVVCVGIQTGIISGHRDGTLRPQEPINLAEASKILVKAYSLAYPRLPLWRGNWYDSYIYDLRNRGGIPAYLQDAGKALTRRDVARMLYGLRHREGRFNLPKRTVTPNTAETPRPRTLPVRPLHTR